MVQIGTIKVQTDYIINFYFSKSGTKFTWIVCTMLIKDAQRRLKSFYLLFIFVINFYFRVEKLHRYC